MEMEPQSHTFPVPEPEAHKLDEVTETLRREPALTKVEDLVRTYPWRALGIAFAVGFVTAKLIR